MQLSFDRSSMVTGAEEWKVVGASCFCRTPQDSWRVGRITKAASEQNGSVAVHLQAETNEEGSAAAVVTVPQAQLEPLDDPQCLRLVDDLFACPTLQPWAILNQIRGRYLLVFCWGSSPLWDWRARAKFIISTLVLHTPATYFAV